MNKVIYVVDDEPSIKEILVALLQQMGDWEVFGFDTPAEALTRLQTQVPDLVISDQTMPRMLGSQFLGEVQRRAPHALRILLSGHVGEENMDTIGSAHQYVSKPFDFAQFKASLHRLFKAQEAFPDPQLRTLITSLQSLPALPHVYQALMREIDRNDAFQVAQVLAKDPALSTKVIQLANSALFAGDQRATTPMDAVFTIGMSLVQAVALAQPLFARFSHLDHPDVQPDKLWQTSWKIAAGARWIALQQQLGNKQQEDAFLAGLLHTLDLLILTENFPDRVSTAFHTAREHKIPLHEALHQQFNVSPARITAFLLQLWGIDPEVVRAVDCQHLPMPEQFNTTAALHIASRLVLQQEASDISPPAIDARLVEYCQLKELIPQWGKESLTWN